jgi:hypothetical protein
MKVMVFDSHTWSKTGDVGNNSQFWLEAEVLNERLHKCPYSGIVEAVVDVQFKDGRISNGHFKTGINPQR